MTLSFLSSLLAICFTVGCVTSNNNPNHSHVTTPTDLASILTPIVTEHKLPAMAAVIVEGDRITAHGIVGVRRRGDPTLASLHDRFHIGSCTKAMTATLIAILISEGKLLWTSTVGEIFPALAMHPQWKNVPITQLLAHQSGAPADLQEGGLWEHLWNHKGPPMEARRILTESVLSRPPTYTPGTQTIYSNAGYAIAGHMAEQITGQPWEHLMGEKIFIPLQMASAGFGAPGSFVTIDEPRGHTENGEPVDSSLDNPSAIGPANSVHLSIGDWAKFAIHHLRGAQGHPTQLPLSSEVYETLHTAPPGSDHALGWLVLQREWGNGKVLTHAGSNTMWYAAVWISPHKNFTVLVMTNQGGKIAEHATNHAAEALIWHATQDSLHTKSVPAPP